MKPLLFSTTYNHERKVVKEIPEVVLFVRFMKIMIYFFHKQILRCCIPEALFGFVS